MEMPSILPARQRRGEPAPQPGEQPSEETGQGRGQFGDRLHRGRERFDAAAVDVHELAHVGIGAVEEGRHLLQKLLETAGDLLRFDHGGAEEDGDAGQGLHRADEETDGDHQQHGLFQRGAAQGEALERLCFEGEGVTGQCDPGGKG